ncbi:TPR repeat-containing protein DDB_G0287407-like [Ptychodera flava]|uniref:TPR repeat-containing protein DDB_G0287407-like n=1 Tax=Ptychodera flava TaxID=63121 RepID=UPI00396A5009
MATKDSQKHTIRVFFSSPFGGLEKEREELTKKYWPQLSSMCSKAGYEFIPVDLRWGITTEISTNAGTVEVCLRQMDISDMIVGFFGQRYGWHGDNELLQKSIDTAAVKYPWLENVRDKSVTEMEFLHGHLNNPGERAACFYFRDKAYDDEQLAMYEAEGNEMEARKYRAETDGPNAAEHLSDLKRRVKDTEDKCLQVVDNYSTPALGARLMFETIKKHLQETFLASPVEKVSEYEKELRAHRAFYKSRLGVGVNQEYIGGDRYLKEVDRHVLSDIEDYVDKPLLITGTSGIGKTTVLANWVSKHQTSHPDDIIAYHFVGCAPRSTGESDVLSRLVEMLNREYEKSQEGKTEDADKDGNADDTEKKETQEKKKTSKDRNMFELYKELMEVLTSITNSGHKAIIVIDGLDKLDDVGKTAKELYWIPTDLPKGVSLLLSCLSTDEKKISQLVDERQYDTLAVESLTTEHRESMTKAVLSLRGKVLTPEQTSKVIGNDQTENPLYLKVALQELCNFGDFFKLDEHIKYIMSADSTKKLFTKILLRLEKDFLPTDSTDNWIAKLMGFLLVSRYGLTEQEIKYIVGIPDQLWAAIYFTIEDFLVDRDGIYGIAYDELSNAVRERYCAGEEIYKSYIDVLATYFEKKLEELGSDHRTKIPSRIIDELPWLLQKYGDHERLQKCLLHLGVFLALFEDKNKYDLFNYWNSMSLAGHEILSLYTKSLDKQVAHLYLKQLEIFNIEDMEPPAKQLLPVASKIGDFLSEAGHLKQVESILLRSRRMFDCVFSKDDISTDKTVAEKYCDIMNKLACTYVDTEKFEKAEPLHKEVLEIKQDKLAESKSYIATSVHGLGVLYLKQRRYQEAEEYFTKALELHRAELPENHALIADTLNNIASVYIDINDSSQNEKAKDVMEEAMKIYEICYFGNLPTEVAGAVNNLAICYRRLGEYEKAEPMYKRAYDMTINAVGERHPDVAEKLTNWGVFEMQKQNYDLALEKYHQALEIYKETLDADHISILFLLENITFAFVYQGKFKEAHPYFKEASEKLFAQGRLDASPKQLNYAMMDYYLRNDEVEAYEFVQRIVTAPWANENVFAALDYFDKQLPENERPNRPYEHTVDYALTRFPKSNMLLLRKTEEYAKSGNAEMLCQILLNGEFEAPKYTAAYQSFVENDHRQEGLDVLKQGKEKFPEDVEITYNIGMWYAFYKDYDKAIDIFQNLLEIDPNDAETVFSLGKVLLLSGQKEKAKAQLEKVLEMAKESNDADKMEQASHILEQIELDHLNAWGSQQIPENGDTQLPTDAADVVDGDGEKSQLSYDGGRDSRLSIEEVDTVNIGDFQNEDLSLKDEEIKEDAKDN